MVLVGVVSVVPRFFMAVGAEQYVPLLRTTMILNIMSVSRLILNINFTYISEQSGTDRIIRFVRSTYEEGTISIRVQVLT